MPLVSAAAGSSALRLCASSSSSFLAARMAATSDAFGPSAGKAAAAASTPLSLLLVTTAGPCRTWGTGRGGGGSGSSLSVRSDRRLARWRWRRWRPSYSRESPAPLDLSALDASTLSRLHRGSLFTKALGSGKRREGELESLTARPGVEGCKNNVLCFNQITGVGAQKKAHRALVILFPVVVPRHRLLLPGRGGRRAKRPVARSGPRVEEGTVDVFAGGQPVAGRNQAPRRGRRGRVHCNDDIGVVLQTMKAFLKHSN